MGAIMIEKIRKYIFYFFSFAFMGWVWEVILNLISKHQIINPGTLIGPWLPIYGWGMILIILISKKTKKKSLLFLISFVLCGIIEYCTSLYLEYFYQTKWWDYSNFLLNINGRVCIEGLIFFATLSVLSIYFVIPILNNIFEKLNGKGLTIILIILTILYSFDYIYSTIHQNIISRNQNIMLNQKN